MSNSDRRQLVIERILEDEHLRGDLEDAAARELLGWATARASVIAGNPANTDADVQAQVRTLRQAALSAASMGEQDPARVVALAESALAAVVAPAGASAGASEARPMLAPVGTGMPAAPPDLAIAGPGAPTRIERVLRHRRSRLAPLLRRLREGR